MSDERENGVEKFYTGRASLDSFSKSVAMIGSTQRPTKVTVTQQKYANIKKWWLKYSKRFKIEDGKLVSTENGAPIFPTVLEVRKELGLTSSQLTKTLRELDDDAIVFFFPDSELPEFGVKQGVNYVIIESLYPELYPIVKKKVRT